MAETLLGNDLISDTSSLSLPYTECGYISDDHLDEKLVYTLLKTDLVYGKYSLLFLLSVLLTSQLQWRLCHGDSAQENFPISCQYQM